jgi:lysophospholipase L1-like esterase
MVQRSYLRRGLLLGLVGLLVVMALASGKKRPHAAVRPVPRPQKRWQQRHQRLRERARKGDVEVLFLGDSITHGWEVEGKEVWAEHFAPLGAANFGMSSDHTQHVLWRITEGKELEGLQARVVVLLIGTNNTGADLEGRISQGGQSAAEIAEGVAAIVQELRRRQPQAHILLLGIFPRAASPDAPVRARVKEVNERIAKLGDQEKVHYLDIGVRFLGKGDVLSAEVMPDFLHLSPKGYRLFADAITPEVKRLLKE